MKLYVVKYCANEFDDLGYDSPYPIYYSLDEHKARNFFEEKREQEIENFNDYMDRHPELQNNAITIEGDKHNSMYDAKVIKKIYEIIESHGLL